MPTSDEIVAHLGEEAAFVATVVEQSLDRAIAFNESQIEPANPIVPQRDTLDGAAAVRFEIDESSWACVLPPWLVPDGTGTVKDFPDDFPARLVAALLPESAGFHNPRMADAVELLEPEVWHSEDRPLGLRLPCDGRDEALWLLGNVPTERLRIGHDRLTGVPINVVVTLAEKRIEIGQLAGISPGTLLTFAKPCEELLDLYVNNRQYCRGEAVKIGEKFGLKVTEIGVERPRISPVMSPGG